MPHFAIINEDDDVYVFGDNSYGQLGLGDYDNRHSPAKLENLPKIMSTATGDLFTLLLDFNGGVWICGKIPGYKTDIAIIPDKLMVDHEIVEIACGSDHYLLLDYEGSVFSCGSDRYGQLGVKSKKSTSPCKINCVPEIKNVHAGRFLSILIDIHGSCWVFGSIFSGNGLNRVIYNGVFDIQNIINASCGSHHAIFIDHEGSVFIQIWSTRQLVTLSRERLPIPQIIKVACGDCHTLLLDINGDVWFCGYKSSTLNPVKISSGIVNIITCGNSVILITENHECLSFGDNPLGRGDTVCRSEPTQIQGFKCKVKHRNFLKTKSARNVV